MNDTWYSELLEFVIEETKLLDEITSERKRFALAVRNRDWPRLETAIEALQRASDRLGVAETCRAELWERLRISAALPADAGLVRVLFAVPEPYRGVLHDAIRQMKVSALRARIEGEAVGEYVAATTSAVTSVVDELYPERKGRIYGKSGRAVSRSDQPLVLNTAL